MQDDHLRHLVYPNYKHQCYGDEVVAVIVVVEGKPLSEGDRDIACQEDGEPNK